jgi:ABC-type Fe2+-enterobactin transport system substrate-binding protein
LKPISIEAKISLKIEVFRKNKLVYSTVTKNGDTLFKRDKKGNLLGVQSINILELPFPLKWKAYKDIRFEITVIEADEELHQCIDKASLFLFPEIRVDSPEV